MKEILYLEVPTPDIDAVKDWLWHQFSPTVGATIARPDGIRWTMAAVAETPVSTAATAAATTAMATAAGDSQPSVSASATSLSQASAQPATLPPELSVFVWTVQRTTYLKVFRWANQPLPQESTVVQQLTSQIRQAFPNQYPEPPEIDLSQQSIFEALAERYPKTVRYFQRMPNGEADLTRVYWWEQRWRKSVRQPQQPNPVVFNQSEPNPATPDYDLIYVGGALGVIHAAVMARLGYRVLLIERLPFGRMNREWNISRSEFQSLIDLGLFTADEFESLIAAEYVDGFHKFFDANNPPQCKAPILHTPTVLNVAIDAEKLLRLCGDKLLAAGGTIWDETEFVRADIHPNLAQVETEHIPTGNIRMAYGRVLVDAMGTASPIAWQLSGKRTFDSVCPTVGACVSGGFEPGVWDSQYGDVLNSHGDISKGRQLIWELFPAKGDELTIYLFHYHKVHPDNPGSLLEMYEDFFTILPEYRRCDMDKLTWRKATFGYIPGHFSLSDRDRKIAFDRLIAIGDAASLQSPLVFTGFGSLVRNLYRLTDLLSTALRHDLVQAKYLNKIRAYQSNIAVTWLFSKGMMVPTHKFLPPERINSMLNTFFGILGSEPYAVAESFIKDRAGWIDFNRMALKAAWRNPALLQWIWELAGPQDMLRWVFNYIDYTRNALVSRLLQWLPLFLHITQSWLEPTFPALWFSWLARSYAITYGIGRPPIAKAGAAAPSTAPPPAPDDTVRPGEPTPSIRAQAMKPSSMAKSASQDGSPQ